MKKAKQNKENGQNESLESIISNVYNKKSQKKEKSKKEKINSDPKKETKSELVKITNEISFNKSPETESPAPIEMIASTTAESPSESPSEVPPQNNLQRSRDYQESREPPQNERFQANQQASQNQDLYLRDSRTRDNVSGYLSRSPYSTGIENNGRPYSVKERIRAMSNLLIDSGPPQTVIEGESPFVKKFHSAEQHFESEYKEFKAKEEKPKKRYAWE